jgi:hypothetical protein
MAKISDLLIPASQISKSEVVTGRYTEVRSRGGTITTTPAKVGQRGMIRRAIECRLASKIGRSRWQISSRRRPRSGINSCGTQRKWKFSFEVNPADGE